LGGGITVFVSAAEHIIKQAGTIGSRHPDGWASSSRGSSFSLPGAKVRVSAAAENVMHQAIGNKEATGIWLPSYLPSCLPPRPLDHVHAHINGGAISG